MVLIWLITLISFGYYSLSILFNHGYLAFFPPIAAQASLQVFLDLCITGLIALFLMYDRRKKHHKTLMPVIITAIGFCLLGSSALLIYMIFDWITQKEKPSQRGLSSR